LSEVLLTKRFPSTWTRIKAVCITSVITLLEQCTQRHHSFVSVFPKNNITSMVYLVKLPSLITNVCFSLTM